MQLRTDGFGLVLPKPKQLKSIQKLNFKLAYPNYKPRRGPGRPRKVKRTASIQNTQEMASTCLPLHDTLEEEEAEEEKEREYEAEVEAGVEEEKRMEMRRREMESLE